MSFSTITEMFLNSTTEFSDKYMYYYTNRKEQWEGLRGKDIRQTVEDLAFALKSLGLGTGLQGAILSNNGPRWAMADYAILCSGAATAAIYPTLTAPQIAYILSNSESKTVFVENAEQGNKVLDIWDDCPDLQCLVVMKDADKGELTKVAPDRVIYSFIDLLEIGHKHGMDNNLNFEELCKTPKPEDLLTLIYTSGTTGNPKGVMLTHNNMVTNIEGALSHIMISPDDVLLSFLPLSHSFERMAGHFLTMSRGATVYYAESIEKVAANMLVVKPTIMIGAPRFYEKVYNRVIDSISAAPAIRQKLFWWAMKQGRSVLYLEMAGKKPGGFLGFKHGIASKLVFSKLKGRVGGMIKFFVSGSAPLSAKIAEFFAMMGMAVIEGYGLTETSPVVTVNKIEHFKFGKVGPAIPDVEIKIAKDGEIMVKGPNVMRGYFRDEKATKEAIEPDGWFHTGDIGQMDSDGFLKITDRKKFIIVTSGGKNVAPAPLENALVISSYIDQVLVMGDKRNFMSALIVPNFEKLEAFAIENGIEDRNPETLIKNQLVIDVVDQEVAAAMEPFARYEQIRKVALLPRELTIDRGEITPTLKVKRNVVFDHFSDVIEGIYEGQIVE